MPKIRKEQTDTNKNAIIASDFHWIVLVNV